jgi:hypothetical protein
MDPRSADLVPPAVVPGTFDWLASIFKAHQKWKEIDHKTQRLYDQGLSLFANHMLKDGIRAGSKQIGQFTKGFVDAIYAKLLMVEKTDKDGNTIYRERRRFANAAMVACRRAWFVGQRAREKDVCRRPPQVQPTTAHLCKTHPQTADLGFEEAASGANKGSRFVGIAADRLSE